MSDLAHDAPQPSSQEALVGAAAQLREEYAELLLASGLSARGVGATGAAVAAAEAHGISVPSAVSGHSVAQVDQEAVALAAAAVADAVDESAQEGPFAAPRYQMPTEASLLREAASGRGGRSVADLDIDDMSLTLETHFRALKADVIAKFLDVKRALVTHENENIAAERRHSARRLAQKNDELRQLANELRRVGALYGKAADVQGHMADALAVMKFQVRTFQGVHLAMRRWCRLAGDRRRARATWAREFRRMTAPHGAVLCAPPPEAMRNEGTLVRFVRVQRLVADPAAGADAEPLDGERYADVTSLLCRARALMRARFAQWRRFAVAATRRQHVTDREGAAAAADARARAEMTAAVESLQRQVAEEKQRTATEVARREALERSMKQSFMRGVCALNMEAMTIMGAGSAVPLTGKENEPNPNGESLFTEEP